MRWEALPVGAWGPPLVRTAFGKLRGTVRQGQEQFAMYPALLNAVTGLLSGLPVPDAWCVGLLPLIALVSCGGILLILVARPNRSRLAGTLHATSLCVVSTIAVLSTVVVAMGADASSSWRDAVFALVAVVSSCVSVVRTLESGCTILFERRMRKNHFAAAVHPPPLCSTELHLPQFVAHPTTTTEEENSLCSSAERMAELITMICCDRRRQPSSVC